MLPDQSALPHEDPIEAAGQKAASHITVALALAQRYIDAQRRKLAGDSDHADAAASTDPRQIYAVMLGRDKGRTATTDQTLAAWAAAQPLRETRDDADLAYRRAHDRLHQLHPDAMARYDQLRASMDPAQAMAEVAPLITADTLIGEGLPGADDDLDLTGDGPDLDQTVDGPDLDRPDDGVARTDAQDHAPAVRDALDPELAASVLADPRWTELATVLGEAEQAGADATQLLRDAAAQREMATAKHPAQVLRSRLAADADQHPPTAPAAGTSAAADAEPDTGTASFPVPITAIPLPAGYSGAAAVAGGVIAAELAIDLDAHLHTSTRGDAAASDASTPAHEQAAATANSGNASPAGTGPTQPGTASIDTAVAAGPAGAASFPTPVTAIPLPHALAAASAGAADAADTLQQVTARTATAAGR